MHLYDCIGRACAGWSHCTNTDDESLLCGALYMHVPYTQRHLHRSRLDRLTENSQLLSPDENFMPFLDISRVHHYYAVSSQVRTLLLSAAVAFAKEGVLESLTEDIANAHEHPRTMLTGSFGIAYFTTVGCTGAAKRADVLATDEAGTPQLSLSIWGAGCVDRFKYLRRNV